MKATKSASLKIVGLLAVLFIAIVDGLPPLGLESFFRGFSWRLFLPAQDADELKQNFESSDLYDSSTIRRLTTLQDYVIADIHTDQLTAIAAHQDAELPTIDYGAGEGDIWARRTPAQAEFLESNAAFGLYIRNEDLPTFAALTGSLEVLAALERVPPADRFRLLSMGFELAGVSLPMASPEVREFEDLSLIVEADNDGDLALRTVRTPTSTGAELTTSQPTSHRFERQVLDDPVVDLVWGRPDAVSTDEVDYPRWMSALEDREDPASALADHFRDGGFWPYLIAQANYPRAFKQGIQRVPLHGELPVWNLWQHVSALAISMDWVASDDAPLGGGLRGHMTIIVDSDSVEAPSITPVVSWVEQYTTAEVSVDSEDFGEKTVHQIAVGESESSAEMVDLVGGQVDLSFDLRPIEATLRQTSMAAEPHVKPLLDLLSQLSQGQMESRNFAHLSMARLRFHGDDLQTPEVPETDAPLIQPERTDECLEELRWASRRVANQRRAPRLVGPIDIRALADFYEIASTCDDDASTNQIQWLKSRWHASVGNVLREGSLESSL